MLSRPAMEEIRASSGQKAPRVIAALERAAAALTRERPAEAERAASEAKSLAPRSATARELLGLALYHAGKWREALRELQAFRRLSGRPDQNHLIADVHRALGAPEKALPLVRDSLRAQLPDEVRAEAAVVGAAALADLHRYPEALTMLRRFEHDPATARPHDLRVWYVMADILERSGRTREAVERFRRILRHEPDAFDVAERIAALS